MPVFPEHLVIHADIHIHLSHILMTHLSCLDVDKDEGTQEVVVEHEVDEIITCVSVYVLLSGYEGISFPHFHHEMLKMIEDGLLKVIFREIAVGSQTQEFSHDRALDVFLPMASQGSRELLHLLNDRLGLRRLQEAVIILGGDVTAQDPYIPSLLGGFIHVPLPSGWIRLVAKYAEM